MSIDLVKENIECEQLLGENNTDTVVKAEYVIPDTHPDVYEILMLDVKPCITNREVMQDKVYLEGQVEYNVLYLAREEEKSGVYNVTYTGKFSNTVDVDGAYHKMPCEAECYVEHMEPSIVNERKIAIEGVIKLKSSVYKNYDFQIIRDITGLGDVQLLRAAASVDKIVGTVEGDLIAKSHIQIPKDKPQVGNVLKCDLNIHKKEAKVNEGKIQVGAFAHIQILYRGKDTRDVCYIEDDILVNKEIDLEGAEPSMDSYSDFRVDAISVDVKEDDLGENRLVDIEALIKASAKAMYKAQMDTIEDAYSPSMHMEMTRKDYELNVMHGHCKNEAIVKGNIELPSEKGKAEEVVMSTGNVCITDKKLVEDKMIIEGLFSVSVMYRTSDDLDYLCSVSDDIPFTTTLDIPGTKIDMQTMARASLENIEASIEANTIAVKAIVEVYGRVNYNVHKDFLVDVTPMEGEKPKKKASITIYVVQNDDTMWKIAKNYHTTMDTLMKINEIEDLEGIKPGDKLIIPGRALI